MRPPPPGDLPHRFACGPEQIVEDRVVEAIGDGFQMGQRFGAALQEEIRGEFLPEYRLGDRQLAEFRVAFQDLFVEWQCLERMAGLVVQRPL